MRFLLEQLKLFFIGAQAEEHGSAHAPQRLPEWADYSSYLATESVRLLESGWPKPKMLCLFQKINASYPLTIQAATGNGCFDLQLTQQSFGPLPTNDERILAGKERIPDDPLADLPAGVIDVNWMRLLNELTRALIEQGQPALFYEIQCPEFPDDGTNDDGTNVVNARIHSAATSVARYITAERGAFPGVILKFQVQPDENWLHSVEFLK